MKRCPADGREYDIDTKEISVPKSEADKYKVVVVEICEPDSLTAALSAGDKRAADLIDMRSLLRDPATSSLLKDHPDWEPLKAFYVSRGILIEGMNKEQVLAAVGEPIHTDIISRGPRMFERWRFGDPLYSMPINRFAIFHEGKLQEFYEFPELVKLFREIIAERSAHQSNDLSE